MQSSSFQLLNLSNWSFQFVCWMGKKSELNEPFDLIDMSESDSIPKGKIVQFANRSITSPTILSRLNKTYDFLRVSIIDKILKVLAQNRENNTKTGGSLFLSFSFISEISSGGSQDISVPAVVSSAVIFLTIGGEDELLKFKLEGFRMIGFDPDPTIVLGWINGWAKGIFVCLSVRTATCVFSNSILKK